MRCPLPIVKLSLAIKKLDVGQQVEIHATDPAFYPDIVAWSRQLGHRLVSYEHGTVQRAVVEKGGADARS